MNLRSLRGVAVRGKRVLVRTGLNVPLNDRGRIADATRLTASLPTLRWLIQRRAKLILLSHIGRPGGRRVPKLSLMAVSERLAALLHRRVRTLPDCIGPTVERAVASLHAGQVLLLENLRFHPEEEVNDAVFARRLARLGDLYVDDAFENAHRSHASMVAITHYLPSYAGLLLEAEVRQLTRILKRPRRPFVTIIGGAKISTKLGLIRTLLPRVDYLLLGGALANTLLKAQGIQVGKSVIEPTIVRLLRRLPLTNPKLQMPIDVMVASRVAADVRPRRCAVGRVRPGEFILDIGSDTLALYRNVVRAAGTIVWNGPMGYNELPAFSRGTKRLAQAIAASSATSILGGGETIEALRTTNLLKRFSFVSTGGGAMLEFLEGKPLPALKPLLRP